MRNLLKIENPEGLPEAIIMVKGKEFLCCSDGVLIRISFPVLMEMLATAGDSKQEPVRFKWREG